MKLTLYERVRSMVPKPLKAALRPALGLFTTKYASELGYWKNRHRLDGFEPHGRYRRDLLAMAREADASFLAGKIVADFGCGPQGSLSWLDNCQKVGIDVLASAYADAFPEEIVSHGMVYVTATETVIPMPTASVDVMFTLNALDHTANLEAMCSELARIVKPGGELIGGFNLHEPATYAEPQTLTEELLDRLLFRHFAETFRHVEPSNGTPTHMVFRGTRLLTSCE